MIHLSYPIILHLETKASEQAFTEELFRLNLPIGVLCLLGPILSWPVRGGVTLVSGWMVSPSFGKVKWNGVPRSQEEPALIISGGRSSSSTESITQCGVEVRKKHSSGAVLYKIILTDQLLAQDCCSNWCSSPFCVEILSWFKTGLQWPWWNHPQNLDKDETKCRDTNWTFIECRFAWEMLRILHRRRLEIEIKVKV